MTVILPTIGGDGRDFSSRVSFGPKVPGAEYGGLF